MKSPSKFSLRSPSRSPSRNQRRSAQGAAARCSVDGFRGLAVAGLLGLISACGGDGRTAVVVYSPHGRDLLQEVERAYEAQRPEVDLRFLDMGSQEVLDRLRSERANPQADVWFGGPKVLFARAAEQGLLSEFEPTWTAGLADGGSAPDRTWHALYRTPTLIVFNREAVASDEAPTDWDLLLDPQWSGKILIRDPLASGTMRTIFGYLISRTESEEAGFEWLARLDGQTREYVHNPALLHEKIIRQEGLVTVWEMTDILGLIDRGAPLDYRFPTSGAPVIDDAVALVARPEAGPEEAAARAFVEWLGSEEALRLAAESAFRMPARPIEDGPDWLDRIERELAAAEVDWLLLQERGAEWMKQWDRQIRGRGTRSAEP